MVWPAVREVKAQVRGLGCDRTAIETHAGARVVGRETDDRSLLHAIGAHLPDHLGDVRAPVSHGHVNRNGLGAGSQLCFDHARLLEGDLGERAASDERIAALNLFDHLRRQRPSAGHVAQVFGNLLDSFGRAVSQQEDCLFCHGEPPHKRNDCREPSFSGL